MVALRINVVTLRIMEAAKARIRLNREHAVIVRARDELIAMAPGHAVAAAVRASASMRRPVFVKPPEAWPLK
jgi:hypothetical protein